MFGGGVINEDYNMVVLGQADNANIATIIKVVQWQQSLKILRLALHICINLLLELDVTTNYNCTHNLRILHLPLQTFIVHLDTILVTYFGAKKNILHVQ